MTFKENNPGIFEFKKEGDKITGTLIKIKSDVGPMKSMMYSIEVENKETEEKEIFQVWGAAILDEKMIGVKEGDVIQIIYDGLGTAKPGHNAPKQFRVLVDRD